jgi:hypothetical protein
MDRKLLYLLVFFLLPFILPQAHSQSRLKFVIYDFDGLNTGETNLPDGDYKSGDLTYQAVPNPLGFSDMLGDRSLECKLNWSVGRGDFGKGISRYFELSASKDYFNFYIYNPTSNSGDAIIEAVICEDDDNDDAFDPTKDDIWKKEITVTRSGSWQLVSIPLKDFVDANAGGNGVFDAAFTGSGGMLHQFYIRFKKPTPSSTSDTYFLDMINFSEGPMPHGNSILDLPYYHLTHGCLLGAYTLQAETAMDKVPAEIEGLFPSNPAKKIRYVNTFLPFSTNGQAVPSKMPGQDVKALLNMGYRPILSWEPLYMHKPRLDPVQPRLQNILNGEFDAYFYQFGQRLAEFNDTVIVRLMHEFEGNWYPWSLVENDKDPQKYIAAFRKVVDIVRSAGATKVQWMWCLNSLPAPSRRFNWVVGAYPGDNYVDIVATDIYNHPDLGVPYWNSFRFTGIETYYYLSKYFPHKPLYICEVGCRERYSSEPASSQTKAEWLIQMDKEMKTFFHETRALIFFNTQKEHDWRIQSSQASLDAITSKIWNDPYYFSVKFVGIPSEELVEAPALAYPNPAKRSFTYVNANSDKEKVRIYNYSGTIIFDSVIHKGEKLEFGNELPAGVYLMEINNERSLKTQKLIKL